MAVSAKIWPTRLAYLALVLGPLASVAALGSAGCTSIDPGPNFVITDEVFDADFYYCHVEPELIVAKKCGPGDPSKGDTGSCHFSASVSGMALIDHRPIDCGGGDHPLNRTDTAGAPQSDLEGVSLEMSRDYTTAPLYIRPSGNNHPRQIFTPDDAQVRQLLSKWASK